MGEYTRDGRWRNRAGEGSLTVNLEGAGEEHEMTGAVMTVKPEQVGCSISDHPASEHRVERQSFHYVCFTRLARHSAPN